MHEMQFLGRLVLGIGIVLVVLGLLLSLVGRIPFIGRLPGDIFIRRGNLTVYIPLATSLLLSIILSLVFWVLRR